MDPRTNTLWANSLSNTEGSGVFHYDLATGRLIEKYVLPADLMFNDLDVTSKGDVFATATRAQALYWIPAKTGKLEEWRPGLKLRDANGIALSSDQRRLFISTFPDGVTVIDLESGSVRGLAHAASIVPPATAPVVGVSNNGLPRSSTSAFTTLSSAGFRKKRATRWAMQPFWIAISQLHNYAAKGIVDRAKAAAHLDPQTEAAGFAGGTRT